MTIDWWTLGLQTVNVMLLVWLLGRFFWRPVSAMIEQRRVTAQQILTDAEGKRNQASAALAEIEQTRAGFVKEREAILAAAHEAAERAKAASIEDAASKANSLEAAAKLAIEKEKIDAEKAWADRASQLAVEIAGRLIERLDGDAVRTAFLEWLLKEIRALPEAVRHAAIGKGVTLKAVTATPLTTANQEHYRTQIGEAFGASPEISFKTDPNLIAGLELHGSHLIVSNSWRADLAKILEDVTHDSRP